jgi:hypothetical protein
MVAIETRESTLSQSFRGQQVAKPMTVCELAASREQCNQRLKNETMTQIVPSQEKLAKLVFLIRGEKVLIDTDLAELYGVATKVLNQAVKRNLDRFPADFMFQLTPEEWQGMRSQTVTASRRNIGALPYAFTEQGVAMLSSVLRSQRAVEVNIAIMRTFVQLRRLMDSNHDLRLRIEAMETRYDEQFSQVFDAIKQLITEDKTRKAKRPIGFL